MVTVCLTMLTYIHFKMSEQTLDTEYVAELSIKDGSASKFAVIVAAGSGLRAGGGLPKQFHELAGVPMLWHSVRSFLAADDETLVVLVLSEEGIGLWRKLRDSLPDAERKIAYDRILMVCGGMTRTESVFKALVKINGIARPDSLVAIHDAARPMVSPEMILRGWKKAKELKAAIPVVALTDSIRRLNGAETLSVDRSDFVAVQTPQIFQWSVLWNSYNSRNPSGVYTDDASVVEKNCKIALFDGDPVNMKVTLPYDFIIAEALLKDGNQNVV